MYFSLLFESGLSNPTDYRRPRQFDSKEKFKYVLSEMFDSKQQFIHACNFHISSFMLLQNRLFQRPNYLTSLVFTYLLFSCGIRPSLLVLRYCHFTLYFYFTHAYFFSFTSKSPCISVHYSTLWITFWRQYVTARPPGLLPCARSLVWYCIHPRILSDRGSSSDLGNGAQRNNTHHMVLI